jgi:hypothetical protein|tara:strand:+ start:66 stop:926 length:861 start_codon:yes stop_codon:yes gene_type:complete
VSEELRGFYDSEHKLFYVSVAQAKCGRRFHIKLFRDILGWEEDIRPYDNNITFFGYMRNPKDRYISGLREFLTRYGLTEIVNDPHMSIFFNYGTIFDIHQKPYSSLDNYNNINWILCNKYKQKHTNILTTKFLNNHGINIQKEQLDELLVDFANTNTNDELYTEIEKILNLNERNIEKLFPKTPELSFGGTTPLGRYFLINTTNEHIVIRRKDSSIYRNDGGQVRKVSRDDYLRIWKDKGSGWIEDNSINNTLDLNNTIFDMHRSQLKEERIMFQKDMELFRTIQQ